MISDSKLSLRTPLPIVRLISPISQNRTSSIYSRLNENGPS